MATPAPTSSNAQSPAGITLTLTVQPPAPVENNLALTQQPSLNDLRAVATDIKDTLFAAITDLRHEIQTIAGRVQRVENTAAQHNTAIQKVHHKTDTHTLQLRDLQRHVEDLDNRGRRHNLRVRGLPESVDNDQILPAVTDLFNRLLDRPRHTPIAMERIHRALRPRGRDTDPPRDIVCYVNDFALKEDIFKKARDKQQLTFEGRPIHIYQDLSAITLRHRKDLRPLLDVLRNKGIRYRWKFPFGLQATHQGNSALLRVPEELETFCEILDIPYVDVPNWYADFTFSALDRLSREEPMEAQISSFRRQRSPSANRPGSTAIPLRQPASPMTAPLPRRARRDY